MGFCLEARTTDCDRVTKVSRFAFQTRPLPPIPPLEPLRHRAHPSARSLPDLVRHSSAGQRTSSWRTTTKDSGLFERLDSKPDACGTTRAETFARVPDPNHLSCSERLVPGHQHRLCWGGTSVEEELDLPLHPDERRGVEAAPRNKSCRSSS